MNAQSSSDGARSAQFHVTTETEHRRHSAATATSAAMSVNLTMIPHTLSSGPHRAQPPALCVFDPMVDREAGANSLRGGRNTYSSKCRIGNFVEEEFRPEVQRKGFTKVRGSSSARAALYPPTRHRHGVARAAF